MSTCQYRLSKYLIYIGYTEQEVYDSLNIKNSFKRLPNKNINNSINIIKIKDIFIEQLNLKLNNDITTIYSTIENLKIIIKTIQGEIIKLNNNIKGNVDHKNRPLTKKKRQN